MNPIRQPIREPGCASCRYLGRWWLTQGLDWTTKGHMPSIWVQWSPFSGSRPQPGETGTGYANSDNLTNIDAHVVAASGWSRCVQAQRCPKANSGCRKSIRRGTDAVFGARIDSNGRLAGANATGIADIVKIAACFGRADRSRTVPSRAPET